MVDSEQPLKLKKWKKYLPKVLWGLVALLLLIFLVRVIIWEHNYYHDKEGSQRDVVTTIANPDVDETEPVEQQVEEYIVAADRPRYLSIPKLNITKARILEMGINNKGELDTPINIFDIGWYFNSSKPGEGGVMLLDGHNGGPTKIGTLKYMPDMMEGDILIVERGDGTIFNYKVVKNVSIPLAQANDYMLEAQKSLVPGAEALTVITCTGEWSQAQQTYLSRQFTHAVLDSVQPASS